MREWHMSPAFAGLIASFGFAAAVVGAIAGGSMGDIWGRKRTIVTSVIIYSVGSFLCALTHTPLWLACFRVLAGIGMGMTLQNEVGLVSEYFPHRYRQAAVAAVTTGMQLGGILSALVAIVLVDRLGWTSAYYFGSLPILLVPVLIRYLPEAPWLLVLKGKTQQLRQVLSELRPDVEVSPDVEFRYPHVHQRHTLTEVFAEGRGLSTILFWTVYFMNIFAIYGTNTWIPKLMMNAGHGMQTSLTIYLALFLGALVASPVLGHLGDCFGAKTVSVMCYICGFSSIAALSLRMNLTLTLVTVAVAGACTQGVQNVTHAYIAEYFPPAVKSTMMGWGLSVGRFGGLLGPIAGGVLLNMHVPQVVSYLAFAVPCLISAVAIVLVQDRFAFNHTDGGARLQEGVG
jgi:AAHS family benzoate transporter-like MFS transporter